MIAPVETYQSEFLRGNQNLKDRPFFVARAITFSDSASLKSKPKMNGKFSFFKMYLYRIFKVEIQRQSLKIYPCTKFQFNSAKIRTKPENDPTYRLTEDPIGLKSTVRLKTIVKVKIYTFNES